MYFFYEITITHQGISPIQLLERYSYIPNVYRHRKTVKGKGVVGEQPIIDAGTYYQYTSGCKLTVGLDKMYGYYTMERLDDSTLFEVEIPKFCMIFPALMN